jgi:SAM-dependent methyltransferase
MSETPPRRVLTKNRMGWASERLGEVSELFVKFAARVEGPVLDVGAGYGAASEAALRAGAPVVIANDLERRHLEELESRLGLVERDRLRTKTGRFPRAIEFEDGSLWAAHASNVFHFLTPRQVREGFRKLARWLRPGGRIFVQAATPYQGVWAGFAAEYGRRVAAGNAWPGVVEKVSEYVTHRQRSQMPRWIHLLDDVVLRREAEAAGFAVERAWLYQRADLPAGLRLDGRETVGLAGVRRRE